MNFFPNKDKIYVIDGGLGTTLHEYGLEILGDPLWSGKILVKQPEQLAKVHQAFVQTKCDFITTASYQISVEYLIKTCQITHEQAEEIIFDSVKIARDAIEKEKAQCYVAASVGPYGAVLCDGSEFNGWYSDSMTIEEFKNWHRPRLEILTRAEPDVIAFETIPCQKEAEALAELLKEFPNIKGWISFNCQDSTRTAHGEAIADAAKSVCLKSRDQIVAIGVNCVQPETVVPLIKQMNALNHDFIAYPNAGVVWNDDKKQFDSQGRSMASYIQSYIDAGIKYIGGCCNVNPDQIRAIRKIVDDYESSK